MTHSTIDSRYFHVYETGPQTVIGFDGRCLAEEDAAWRCQTGLVELVRSHACQVLVVDLTSVDIVSSWILGVLAAIRRMGTEVHVYRPSQDVRDVMRITHLDELMPVRGEP